MEKEDCNTNHYVCDKNVANACNLVTLLSALALTLSLSLIRLQFLIIFPSSTLCDCVGMTFVTENFIRARDICVNP